MKYKIKLLKTILNIHISDKSNKILEKSDTLTFKVNKNVNKIDIKNALNYLFKIKIKKINTLISKIKCKKNKNNVIGYTKQWKKAYVKLYPNQSLIYINKLNEINNEKI